MSPGYEQGWLESVAGSPFGRSSSGQRGEQSRKERATRARVADLDPRFRTLWTAATLSNVGDGVVVPAFALLAASLTRDPLLVSAVTAALWLPWLVVAPVSGALSDRWDRRRTMVWVDAVRFLILAVLGTAVLAEVASIWLLIVVAFLIGAAETAFDTSAEAIVPMVVSRDPARLERANGWLQASEAVSNRLVGPPLGGALFGVAASVPFLIDAVTFGLASMVVSRLPGRYPPAETPDVRQTLRVAVTEGIRWLWDNRILRAIALGAAVGNFAIVAADAILVLFAQDVLGLGAAAYGLLLAAGAVGGLLGSLAATRFAGRMTPQNLLPATFLVAGLAQAAIGLTSNPYVVAALFAAVSLVAVWVSVLIRALRQQLVPDRLLGRVVGAQRMIAFGALPLGALAGGAIGRSFGLAAPFLFGGLVQVLVAIPLWVVLKKEFAGSGRIV